VLCTTPFLRSIYRSYFISPRYSAVRTPTRPRYPLVGHPISDSPCTYLDVPQSIVGAVRTSHGAMLSCAPTLRHA